MGDEEGHTSASVNEQRLEKFMKVRRSITSISIKSICFSSVIFYGLIFNSLF